MTSNSSTRTFLKVFAGVVEKHRNKDAIVTEGKHKVTYGQLFSKACRIAEDLRATGIHEGEPVGIGIAKSAEYIACLLGVWVSGAAFVPVDPVLPKERAQFIVNQLGMRVALVRDAASNALSGFGVKTLSVDGNWHDDGCFDLLEKTTLSAPAERLAYIIYTSGSTGRPKGVMVTHSGIWNFLRQQIEAFKYDENSNSLFVLSTNFDASVSDIGCALLAGSTLFLEPQGLLAPGPHFLDLLEKRNITHMDVPPSLLKTIPCDQAPASLKTIIIGGEACAPDVVRAWAEKCLVVNVYGPTEATVCTSLGACDARTWERPLIGQPLENVDYYLLDDQQNPVPQGTPGELYIGGIQLAKGYADEAELTAKKFVTIDGKRLYRTGDLIVRCSDGEYQFLGRVDRQFKLRGMLVEPEEIEAKLAAHSRVARAAVLKRPLRPGFPGDKLVAFVQPKTGQTLDFAELKQHLARSLPPWMVPQIFETAEQLPLTVTGKIDLSLLKEIPLKAASGQVSSQAKTDTEKILFEVWKQIFQLESVSTQDDFFELGGDSLNVIEAVLAAHLRGLTISPDMLMAHPSIGELSRHIEAAKISTPARESSIASGLTSEFLRNDLHRDNSLQNLISNTVSNSQSSKDFKQSHKKKFAKKTIANVFLTGTTGFLGARLLHELLSHTNAKMFCLIRAGSQDAAFMRIEHALNVHGICLTKSERERIFPVLGDLSAANLGMNNAEWERLTKTVDTVFHSAATVNMVKDYFELRPANVQGTLEIARFIAEGAPKQLHYASTLSVFVATTNNTGTAKETDLLDGQFTVFGGYAQTKVAAELILRQLEVKAGPISYYRFGLLTGDSKSGKSAKDDFLNMFARGISALGCVPDSNSKLEVDITPVDYAARAMAHIAIKNTESGVGNTYHIANETSLNLKRLVSSIRKLGRKLDLLPPDAFFSQLKSKQSKFSSEESAAYLALCRALKNDESFSHFRTMDLFQATDIKFECANTKAALKGTAIKCPKPTAGLIELYMRKALKVFPMAGGTLGHNTICLNIATSLRNRLRASGCKVFICDVKVIANASAYYPDIVVDCGATSDCDVSTNTPMMIFEVLSKSTTSTDRTEKLAAYQSIPTLKDYVLVHQSKKHLEHYRKTDGEWVFREYRGSDNMYFAGPSESRIPLKLSLDDVYEDLAF